MRLLNAQILHEMCRRSYQRRLLLLLTHPQNRRASGCVLSREDFVSLVRQRKVLRHDQYGVESVAWRVLAAHRSTSEG